jgi:hypothetical protein
MRPATIQKTDAKKSSLRWFVAMLALAVCSAQADVSVPLAWNPSPDANVAGYKIYYGGASRTYTNSVDVGNVTSTVIAGLAEGTTYFFAATTYGADGVESDFSDEATAVTANAVVTPPVPPAPPAPVYQSPALDALNNLTINENAGAQTISLTGISLGNGQALNVTAVSSNPALIPNPAVNYNSPDDAGTLTFAPTANASGVAIITVTVDNGLPQNNLVTRSFTITVAAVNQAPTLDPLADISVKFNAAAQVINLTGISAGAAGENQKLKVTAVSSNTKVVGNPKVSYVSPNATGTLSLKPVANASGLATITVTVNDGGASNNITTRSFTVTVLSKSISARPVIWGALTNRFTLTGKKVSFSTKATGQAPLKYQWQHNGVNIAGATTATLTLKSATTKDAGNYTVKVSNVAGSTVSSPASLVIYTSLPPASLESAVRVNGQFAFTVNGVPGYPYAVQASTDLAHWTALETNTAPFVFTDTDASATDKKFYRTVSLNQP